MRSNQAMTINTDNALDKNNVEKKLISQRSVNQCTNQGQTNNQQQVQKQESLTKSGGFIVPMASRTSSLNANSRKHPTKNKNDTCFTLLISETSNQHSRKNSVAARNLGSYTKKENCRQSKTSRMVAQNDLILSDDSSKSL